VPPSGASDFKPAAGVHWLTPVYDLGVALLTRERRWREALLEQVAPADDDVIVDVGCGTGTWLLMAARAAPRAALVGIDPDLRILARARRKAERAGARVAWLSGVGADVASLLGARRPSKIVSSLMLHHLVPDEQARALGAWHAALRPGGELHVADYGLQRTATMRFLFRATVQRLDGVATTAGNARGELPERIGRAGFNAVRETRAVRTPTGSISLYRAERQ
jgi:ubiquinone/menaquinone biosynthesis C-methylase UbiE